MSLFHRDELEDTEFDFSNITLTKQEVADVFEQIASHPRVTEFKYSLPLQEGYVIISGTESFDDETDFFTMLPDAVTVPYAKMEDNSHASLDLEFGSWFKCDMETHPPDYEISPPTQTQLRETAAFLQVTVEQISAVKNARVLQTDSEKYCVGIAFTEDAEITDTYILNQLKEWIGFSYEGFVIEDGQFNGLVMTLNSTYPFQISSSDGFRMQQLRTHEEVAVENQLIARLPCGHSGAIESFFTSFDGDLDQFEAVTLDGCEMRLIPFFDWDGSNLQITENDGDESGFVPLNRFRGSICSDCSKAYVFEDFEAFRDAVCIPLRPQHRKGQDAEGHEYSFALPPVEPVEKEYITTADIQTNADAFDWLLARPHEEK